MLNTTSYAELNSVANIDTLQFDFISMTPNGLLFYAVVSSDVTVKLFLENHFCAFVSPLLYFISSIYLIVNKAYFFKSVILFNFYILLCSSFSVL